MKRYGVCWILWDVEQQAFYEQRDLYRCRVVAVHEYDILDRVIPYGDLRQRESLPIFFSAHELRQSLATDSKSEPVCKKAQAFITNIPGDGLGTSPVSTIDVAVPFSTFCQLADRVRDDATHHGKHVVTLHAYLFYLKAVLFTLGEQIQHEPDPARRRTLIHQRKRIQQMRSIRSQWRDQHKQYVSVEQHSHDTYIVHVGLHSSIYEKVA
jgi:hypothetical protein